MGTYIFKATAMFTRDNNGFNWGKQGAGASYPASDANLISGITNSNPANAIYFSDVIDPGGPAKLTFTGQWFLDGSGTPTDFASLPSGFTVDTCTMTIRCGTLWSNAYAAGYTYIVTFANEINTPVPNVASLIATITPVPLPDAIAVNGFLAFGLTKSMAVGNETYHGFIVSGDYSLFQFAYNMPQDGEDAAVGETITITSNFSSDPLNSMDLTHVTLSMACGLIVPVIQTTDLFTFLVPESCDAAGLQTLTATGDGTQFSGSVPLGTLTILLTNASGIYTLVPGKRQDTYYSSHRDGSTINIKIPNPTGRTGFIGG